MSFRGEIRTLLKVSVGLTFCCCRTYRNYFINVDVHLLCVFLLAVVYNFTLDMQDSLLPTFGGCI